MRERLNSIHPQMLRVEDEGDRKQLAEGRRARIARAVERALEIAGVTKQQAAFAMGYTDQGPVSRWCSGVERPLFDKLFGVPGFEDAYLVALAERNPRVELETTVRIRRTA